MRMLPLVIAMVVACLGLVAVIVLVIKRCLIVVMPNELVILVGRRIKLADGRVVTYRVLTGGRTFRIPFIEQVERIPRGPFGDEVDMREVFTKDGARLRIKGLVEIGISLNPAEIYNAVERFMGRPPEEISKVAVATLEGHIRAVLATMESERAVHDPLYLQQAFMQEADHDFRKLGLELSTFSATARIQHPPPARAEQARSASQRLLDRLVDRDLSAEAKQAAVSAMGSDQFTLLIKVERTNPPSLGELPEDYRDGQAAYGLAPNGLEVEVVFPASREAEVELMDGGGLELPVVVQAQRWDGPRQCLVALAV